MVIPSQFTEHLSSEEVMVEIHMDENNNPSVVITAVDELDSLESDPRFALFIKSVYEDALAHPEKLATSQEVWGHDIKELIEGVDITDEE